MNPLNLLPLYKQQTAARAQIFLALADFLLGTFLLSILVAIITLGGQWLLQTNFISVVREYNLLTISQPRHGQEIKIINFLIDQATLLQKDFWSPLASLNQLESSLPGDVTFKSIELTTSQIKLEATVLTRDAALAWQDRLQKIPGWEKTTLSLNELLQPTPLTIKLILPRL